MKELKEKILVEIKTHEELIEQGLTPTLAQYHLGFIDGLTNALELLSEE